MQQQGNNNETWLLTHWNGLVAGELGLGSSFVWLSLANVCMQQFTASLAVIFVSELKPKFFLLLFTDTISHPVIKRQIVGSRR